MSKRKFLETHAIYYWHPIVLSLLTFTVAMMTLGIFHLGLVNIITWMIYGAFAYLLLFGIVAVSIYKIGIDAQGLWTTRGYFSWEDFEKTKLKWNGRLLILGKEDIFILPKPKEFIKAIETFKPSP